MFILSLTWTAPPTNPSQTPVPNHQDKNNATRKSIPRPGTAHKNLSRSKNKLNAPTRTIGPFDPWRCLLKLCRVSARPIRLQHSGRRPSPRFLLSHDSRCDHPNGCVVFIFGGRCMGLFCLGIWGGLNRRVVAACSIASFLLGMVISFTLGSND